MPVCVGPGLQIVDGLLSLVIATDEVEASESTSSTVYTDLATVGPSITINVGTSGGALIHGGAFVALPTTTISGLVGLQVDGGTEIDFAALGNETGSTISASVARVHLVTGLAPGSHTFKLRYRQAGGTAFFGTRFIVGQAF